MAKTFFGDLLQIPSGDPGPSDIPDFIPGIAYTAGMARAYAYSFGEGLIQPMSSSIFRGLGGKAIGLMDKAAEYAPEALAVVSAADALWAASKGAYQGTCH